MVSMRVQVDIEGSRHGTPLFGGWTFSRNHSGRIGGFPLLQVLK